MLVLFITGVLIPLMWAQASEISVIENPTHILQLIQAKSNNPIDIKVKLFKKAGRKLLANIMPDGQLMESEYIVTKDNAIKFQWVAIKRDGLLAVQFIGAKAAKGGSFQGKYVALVDGELRKDMSGRFILTAIKAL